jgi:hypothetical protein
MNAGISVQINPEVTYWSGCGSGNPVTAICESLVCNQFDGKKKAE